MRRLSAWKNDSAPASTKVKTPGSRPTRSIGWTGQPSDTKPVRWPVTEKCWKWHTRPSAVCRCARYGPWSWMNFAEELRKRPGRGGKPLSENTVHKYLDAVSAVLQDAAKNDILPLQSCPPGRESPGGKGTAAYSATMGDAKAPAVHSAGAAAL